MWCWCTCLYSSWRCMEYCCSLDIGCHQHSRQIFKPPSAVSDEDASAVNVWTPFSALAKPLPSTLKILVDVLAVCLRHRFVAVRAPVSSGAGEAGSSPARRRRRLSLCRRSLVGTSLACRRSASGRAPPILRVGTAAASLRAVPSL